MNEHENVKALSENEEEAVSGGSSMASKLKMPGKQNPAMSKSPISLGEGIPADTTSSEKPRDGGATGGW